MSGGFPGNALCQRPFPVSLWSVYSLCAPLWFTCNRLLLVSAFESIHCRCIWQSSMHLARSESSGYRCQADAVMRGGAAYSNRMRLAHIKAIILFPFNTSTTSLSLWFCLHNIVVLSRSLCQKNLCAPINTII